MPPTLDNTTQALLQKAQQAYQQKAWADAAQYCRDILKRNNALPQVYHLLGVCMAQQSQYTLAKDYFEKAVALAPKNAAFYSSLGNACLMLRQFEASQNAYQEALKQQPHNIEALLGMANICRAQNRTDEALQYYQQLLPLAPSNPHFWNDYGSLYRLQKQYPKAMECFERALAIDPQHLHALNNVGNVYIDTKRWADAQQIFERCLQTNASFGIAHNGLGVVLAEQGQTEQAIEHYQHAIQLNPNYTEALNNLGNLLMRLGRVAESVDYFNRAIQSDPNRAESHYNYGTAMVRLRKPAEGIPYFDTAITLRPAYAEAHWNKAYACLMTDDFKTGWQEFEWRVKLPEFAAQPLAKPAWQGQDISGKRLLVVAEQGFGDTFQFLRYLPLLKRTGAKILFLGKRDLRPIVSHSPFIDEWIAVENFKLQPVEYDYFTYMLSLPRIFGTTPDSIPPLTSGIYALEEALVQTWQYKLAYLDNTPKIGLVWSCESANQTWGTRSIPLNALTPLFSHPSCQFISLQKGSTAQAAHHVQVGNGLLDFSLQLNDFADTACLIKQLDWVITVDTAVAHLCGLMNKEAWVMLPYEADWRWQINQSTSLWYPSLKLFRQPERGHWQPVLDAVQTALSQRLSQ